MGSDDDERHRGTIVPRDVLTGRQAGDAGAASVVEVLVGYLVTHSDGYQVRLDLDRTRAELYAARNRATIEPMYVRRPVPAGPGTSSMPVPAAERSK